MIIILKINLKNLIRPNFLIKAIQIKIGYHKCWKQTQAFILLTS